jgi:hypothetical protein
MYVCMYVYVNMTLYVQVLEKMIEKLARIVKHVLPGASDLALDSHVDAATATWLNESYSGASHTYIQYIQYIHTYIQYIHAYIYTYTHALYIHTFILPSVRTVDI